ncbi:hypothetical protein AMS68_006979 [Peltaster fructicola]|uniref:Uncharacterized protein n=1 Tax=Peltaster fructicola TaxID=286661 RepID=A0A6H0Y365_9PEZI|nr:hypothetical protein AMS68_006979 [Peltaster fructicola]
MAGFLDAVKIITAPALIAAFIFILITFVIVPLVRRHRERYSQYASVEPWVGTPTSASSQVLMNIADFFHRVAERRRRRRAAVAANGTSQDADDVAFGEEEGESMVGFDLSHRERSVRGGNVEVHSDARLSRDLEEGFRDDSEEDTTDDRRRARHAT